MLNGWEQGENNVKFRVTSGEETQTITQKGIYQCRYKLRQENREKLVISCPFNNISLSICSTFIKIQ
jgi:hypothetical protein